MCSDALARGIDIPNVQCVVSYDMPKYIKNHVHRVGRTGRAGKNGIAVTLLLHKEVFTLGCFTAGRKVRLCRNAVKETLCNRNGVLHQLPTYSKILLNALNRYLLKTV